MRKQPLSEFAARNLAQADARAERLLGYVRMAVAIVLAASLVGTAWASQRPDDTVLERRLLFAGIGMLSYFLVGLAVVLFVRQGRNRRWIAWLTALADVGLISWNVFGVVHFSGIGSLYALAFPSSLMIPLILAFGALRYRPDVQVATTVLMAMLITLIVFSDTGAPTDPLFLQRQLDITYGAPPNVIRIMMLMGVGLIIAVAVHRAKALLVRTVTEAEEKANLSRFLPRVLTREMNDAELTRLRQGSRATLGIVFLDIRNFTQASEQSDAQELAITLTGFRSDIVDVVEAHGGIVDKFIGDGALLLFGLNQEPARAARTTLSACTDLAARFERGTLRVGIGAHWGEVFVGAVGDDRRLEFTVIGAAVNLASRIEQMTKSVGVSALVSDALIQAAAGPDDWRKLGEHEIDGVTQPVTLWCLESQG